ncbi:DUF3558 domain-containing protein [Nocardia macrotermitis]|nr:DUF3558 domain-containing protein [Nocardia macrotermitis]
MALITLGCSTSQHGSTTATSTASETTVSKSIGTAPFPTLTVPSLQPPAQHNQGGRPDVVFDPCTWIDDATLTRLGYDPATRKRPADINAEYTFLSCSVRSPDRAYSLNILSGNRTMDEGRSNETSLGAQIQDTTIAGRQAMIARETDPGTCTVLVQTKAGYINFLRRIFADHINGPTPERCSGMTDLVQGILPRVGNN